MASSEPHDIPTESPMTDGPPVRPPTDPELQMEIESQVQHEIALQEAGSGSRLLSFIGWDRFNAEKLINAEKTLLERVKSAIQSRLIPIKLFNNSSIYTVSTKADNVADDKTPLVLLHGFGAGIGIWAANLDSLSKNRPVHGIDMLGFGRSSRPVFSNDPVVAESEFVEAINEWRKSMNIDQMVLAGHSFGGYLAASYALEHPSHVRHLICIDPWGFPERPENSETGLKLPFWIRAVGKVATHFTPLTSLRIAGPYGMALIRRMRPDLGIRYNIASDPNAIYEYIYQINARKPTGEAAFKSLTENFAWARRPMLNRFDKLDSQVPVTFVYGARSWIDTESGFKIQAQRPDSYVDVRTIPGAGHHVYADNHEGFNLAMKEISEIIDERSDLLNSWKEDQENEHRKVAD